MPVMIFVLLSQKLPFYFYQSAVTESLNPSYEVEWTTKDSKELHALHVLSLTLPELLLF